MSNNEAIQVFEELLDVPNEILIKYDSVANEEQKKSLVKIRNAEEMAIQALRTNQLYQEIGTVEECRQAINFKKYFMELYGEGLEVANWHQNGELEPLTEFIDSAMKYDGE